MVIKEIYLIMTELEKIERNRVRAFLNIYSRVGLVASFFATIAIILLSLLPSSQVPQTDWIPFGDKGAHMLAYTCLGICFFSAFSGASFSMHKGERDILDSNWSSLPTLFTIVVGLPIGIIIEFIQSHVGRDFELLDIVADGLGLLVGCAISLFVLKQIISYIQNKVY